MQDDSIRLQLTLAYIGTNFSGWQIQARQRADRERTVQESLELAFGRLLDRPVRVHGASRTDAGVHALGQVAHVDVPASKMRIDWQKACNALLPPDIAVLDVRQAAPGFHARFHAQYKYYTYSLWLTRRYVLPQRRAFVWPVGPLDLEAMDRAASYLVGERDFKCFQNQGTEVASTVRTLMSVQRVPAECQAAASVEVVYRFQGDGFLKQQVRNMVGCLVFVGQGKIAPEAVAELLDGRDRCLAPPAAAARGLTLERVVY